MIKVVLAFLDIIQDYGVFEGTVSIRLVELI